MKNKVTLTTFILSSLILMAIGLVKLQTIITADQQGIVPYKANSKWNDFSIAEFKPKHNEIIALQVNTDTDYERERATNWINYALNDRYKSKEISEYLIPLKRWQSSNIYIVRKRSEDNWLQVVEGNNGIMSIEIYGDTCKIDENIDLMKQIESLAHIWLSDKLMPKGKINIYNNITIGEYKLLASWNTIDTPDISRKFYLAKGISNTSDVVFSRCSLYYNGVTIKFEIEEVMIDSSSTMPFPYLFGDQPNEVKMNTKEPGIKHIGPKETKIEIKKELSPDEIKKEIN